MLCTRGDAQHFLGRSVHLYQRAVFEYQHIATTHQGAARQDHAKGTTIEHPTLALLVVGVAKDVVEARVLVRHPAERQRVVPAREGLQHQAAGEQVQPRAAQGFRHRDAEVAGAPDQRNRAREVVGI